MFYLVGEVMSKKKILFIDDERLACKYFGLMFNRYFDVETAQNLFEAESKINADSYDFVICDYNLGEDQNRNGLEFLLDIKDKYKDIKLFLCSAYIFTDLNVEHNITYISKPFDGDELIEQLNH